jgi:hypothetical protein
MPQTYTQSIVKDPNASGSAVLSGNPSSNGSRGLCLNDGDTFRLTIDTKSFPSTTLFQSITFFPTSDETRNGVTLTFPAAPPSLPPTSARKVQGTPNAPRSGTVDLFTVTWTTADLTQPLALTDIEGGSSVQDSAWFAVVLHDPQSNTSWTLDPELVNTSGNQVGWQPAPAATLSRVAVVAV